MKAKDYAENIINFKQDIIATYEEMLSKEVEEMFNAAEAVREGDYGFLNIVAMQAVKAMSAYEKIKAINAEVKTAKDIIEMM